MKKSGVKKILAGISSACMIAAAAMPAASFAVQAAETKTLYGDANCDGQVNMADAVFVMQAVSNPDKYKLTDKGADNADVSERGNGITNKDALAIQQYKLGLVDELPVSYADNGGETTTTTTTTSGTETSTTTTTTTTTTVSGSDESTTTTTTTSTSQEDPVTDTVYIHLSGSKITVEGDNSGYTAVEGSKVTISHSGAYYIDGTLDDGQINVNIADEAADAETVKLFLNGASITGKSAPAILVTNAENTSINLVDGTENFISDGDSAYLDETGAASGDAVIEAKDDLTIKGGEQGTGILNLTANTQDGISCNNDIKLTGGVINVTTLNSTDKTNGIKGKTSVTVKGATVNVEAEGDGIKSGKGSVAFTEGNTVIKAGNDAVQAATTIDISGGTLLAGGDRGLTAETGLNITGGTVVATATDNQAENVTASNQAALLLNCVACADSTDGTWKKANAISVGSVNIEKWAKKYSYVLISDASVTAGKSYILKNVSTGATVTHTGGTSDSFNVEKSVTTFNEVDPAGKDGGSTVVTPEPATDGYTITFSGSGAETNAPSDVASVSGGVITISKAGTFAVSGSSTSAQIVVDVDKTAYPDSVVELDLMGADLSNSTTAPVFVNSIGDEVQIVAKSGTVNTISDGTSHTQTYTDSDGNSNTVEGAIFSRDDIKFKGTGSLTVNGNQDDAIVCKNDIKIYNGNITVNAVDDGIRGKDSVTIGDTTKSDGSAADNSNLKLTVKTTGSGDGIKATATDTATDKAYGVITINGGTIDITAYADGIQAEQEFVMNGGDLNIYTYEGSGFTGSGTTTGGNTGWGGFTGGMGMDGNANKTDISAKGIKAVGLYDTDGTTYKSAGNITINGGNITINSSDDAVHCSGTMNINGGVYKIETADDGFHSDKVLNVGKTAANTYDDVQIFIAKCYEGIEAPEINQNSGTVYIISTDDGYNAGGGADGSGGGNPGMPWGQGQTTSSSNIVLNMNGGFVCINSASGDHDAFDSNGNINLNGGYLCSNGQEPLDCGDGGYSINYNGTSVITMTAGNTNLSSRYSFVDNSGKVIVSFLSASGSPGQNCTNCKAYSGGTVSGGTTVDEQAGSYAVTIGGTLSGGTEITATSSSGGGFGPGGPGRPGGGF